MTIAETRPDDDIEAHVDRLADMDDDEFYAVVREDRRLRGQPDVPFPPLLDALRHDDVLDRWLEMVNRADADMVLSIRMARDRMYAAKAACDYEETSRQRRLRAKAVRALEGVKEQRREVKERIADRNRRETRLRDALTLAERDERNAQRRNTPHEQAYERALRRLRNAHAEEFKQILAECLAEAGVQPSDEQSSALSGTSV